MSAWRLESQRRHYSRALLDMGAADPDLVVVGADTTGSLKTREFGEAYPGRLINVGISEQNMICVAAGLALSGKRVYASTFAVFGVALVYNQIRQSIAYPRANVKIVCSHAGLTVGADGATHQINEDVGLMCGLPNMKVVVPADGPQTYLAATAIKDTPGPFYMRISRADLPTVTSLEDGFRPGKAQVLRDGADITLIANGVMVSRCLETADDLERRGVDAAVINLHTVKPLDEATILKYAKRTGAVLTAEEHTLIHGMGVQVSSLLSRHSPTPMRMVGIDDAFGQSGTPDELLTRYGLSREDILKAAEHLLRVKTLA